MAAFSEAGDVKVFTLMPGSTTYVPTTTLTTDTANGAAVEIDGAGNALVMWSTRDDVFNGDRTARVRLTTIPASGGAMTTEFLRTFVTPSTSNPILAVAFEVNTAGDAVFLETRGELTNTNVETVEYYG